MKWPGEAGAWGAPQAVPDRVNILLNVQFAIRNKPSANRFLFIVLGIFLLFSLKGSPLPNSTRDVFADLRGGGTHQWLGGLSATPRSQEERKQVAEVCRDGSRSRGLSGWHGDHCHGPFLHRQGPEALRGGVVLAK